MKNILTVALIFFSFQGYSQTLEQLQLRLQIVENSTMTLPEFNRVIDSIARRRDTLLSNNIAGWVNAVDRRMNDTVRARIRLVRADAWKLDSTKTAQNAAVQDTNVNQLVALQNQITGLLTEIEALKLRITNLKVTIQ